MTQDELSIAQQSSNLLTELNRIKPTPVSTVSSLAEDKARIMSGVQGQKEAVFKPYRRDATLPEEFGTAAAGIGGMFLKTPEAIANNPGFAVDAIQGGVTWLDELASAAQVEYAPETLDKKNIGGAFDPSPVASAVNNSLESAQDIVGATGDLFFDNPVTNTAGKALSSVWDASSSAGDAVTKMMNDPSKKYAGEYFGASVRKARAEGNSLVDSIGIGINENPDKFFAAAMATLPSVALMALMPATFATSLGFTNVDEAIKAVEKETGAPITDKQKNESSIQSLAGSTLDIVGDRLLGKNLITKSISNAATTPVKKVVANGVGVPVTAASEGVSEGLASLGQSAASSTQALNEEDKQKAAVGAITGTMGGGTIAAVPSALDAAKAVTSGTGKTVKAGAGKLNDYQESRKETDKLLTKVGKSKDIQASWEGVGIDSATLNEYQATKKEFGTVVDDALKEFKKPGATQAQKDTAYAKVTEAYKSYITSQQALSTKLDEAKKGGLTPKIKKDIEQLSNNLNKEGASLNEAQKGKPGRQTGLAKIAELVALHKGETVTDAPVADATTTTETADTAVTPTNTKKPNYVNFDKQTVGEFETTTGNTRGEPKAVVEPKVKEPVEVKTPKRTFVDFDTGEVGEFQTTTGRKRGTVAPVTETETPKPEVTNISEPGTAESFIENINGTVTQEATPTDTKDVLSEAVNTAKSNDATTSAVGDTNSTYNQAIRLAEAAAELEFTEALGEQPDVVKNTTGNTDGTLNSEDTIASNKVTTVNTSRGTQDTDGLRAAFVNYVRKIAGATHLGDRATVDKLLNDMSTLGKDIKSLKVQKAFKDKVIALHKLSQATPKQDLTNPSQAMKVLQKEAKDFSTATISNFTKSKSAFGAITPANNTTTNSKPGLEPTAAVNAVINPTTSNNLVGAIELDAKTPISEKLNKFFVSDIRKALKRAGVNIESTGQLLDSSDTAKVKYEAVVRTYLDTLAKRYGEGSSLSEEDTKAVQDFVTKTRAAVQKVLATENVVKQVQPSFGSDKDNAVKGIKPRFGKVKNVEGEITTNSSSWLYLDSIREIVTSALPKLSEKLQEVLGKEPEFDEATSNLNDLIAFVAEEIRTNYKDITALDNPKNKNKPYNTNGVAGLTDLSVLRQLLTTAGVGSTNQLDNNIVAPIAVALAGYLNTSSRFTSVDDVTRMLNVENLDATSEAESLAKEYANMGPLRKNIGSSIGKEVFKYLNIDYDKENVPADFQERLESSLGALAIAVMQNKGLIEVSSVTAAKYSADMATMTGNDAIRPDDPKAKINFIKPAGKGLEKSDSVNEIIDLLSTEDTSEVITQMFGMERRVKGLRRGKTNKPIRTYSKFGIEMPEKAVEIVQKLQNVAWELNPELTKKIMAEESPLNFLNMLLQESAATSKAPPLTDVTEEVIDAWLADNIHVDNRASVKYSIDGKLESIKRAKEAIEYLQEDPEWNINRPVYMDYFIAKQLRFSPDSNTLNPQGDTLHRRLLTPYNAKKTVSKSSNMDMLYQGVATFFGLDEKTSAVVKAKYVAAIEAVVKSDRLMRKALDVVKQYEADGTIDPIAVADAFATINGNTKRADLSSKSLLGIVALQELVNLHKLQKGTIESYKTNHVVEVDGLTNGFALTLFQIPIMDGTLNDHLNRVGIFDADNEGGVSAYSQKHDDSYENINNFIPANFQNIAKTAWLTAVAFPEKTSAGVKQYIRATTSFLQKAIDEVSVNREKYANKRVKKALELNQTSPNKFSVKASEPLLAAAEAVIGSFTRDMAKNPFMIFNYSASLDRISKNVTSNILPAFSDKLQAIHNMSPEQQLIEIASLTKTLGRVGINLNGLTPDNLLNYKLDYNSKDIMQNVIGQTIGDAMAASVEQSIGANSKYKETINTIFHIQYENFNNAYKKLKAITEKENKEAGKKVLFSETDADALIEKLQPLVPGFSGYFNTKSGNKKSFFPVFKMVKISDKNSNVTIEFVLPTGTKAKPQQSMTLTTLTKTMQSTGVGGFVSMIQQLDATIMLLLAEEFPAVLHVHDAAKTTAEDARDAAIALNKATFEVNSTYSIMDDALTSLTDRVTAYNELGLEDPIDESNFSEYLSKLIRAREKSGERMEKIAPYTYTDLLGEQQPVTGELLGKVGANTVLANIKNQYQAIEQARKELYTSAKKNDQYPSPITEDGKGSEFVHPIGYVENTLPTIFSNAESYDLSNADIQLNSPASFTSRKSTFGDKRQALNDAFAVLRGTVSDALDREYAQENIKRINAQVAYDAETDAIDAARQQDLPLEDVNRPSGKRRPLSEAVQLALFGEDTKDFFGDMDNILDTNNYTVNSDTLATTVELITMADGNPDSEKHNNRLNSVFSDLVAAGLDNMKELSVNVYTALGMNKGRYENNQVDVIIGNHGGKSAKELLAHEMVHAVTATALMMAENFKHLAFISDLHSKVIKHFNGDLTALTSALADKYVGIDRVEAMEKADATVQYVFNNSNTYQNNGKKLNVGLLEFVTYGTTNHELAELLSDIKAGVPQKFDFITGTSWLEQLLNSFYSMANRVFNGTFRIKGDKVDQLLFNTVQDLNVAVAAANKVIKPSITSKVFDVVEGGNKKISNAVESVGESLSNSLGGNTKPLSVDELDGFAKKLSKILIAQRNTGLKEFAHLNIQAIDAKFRDTVKTSGDARRVILDEIGLDSESSISLILNNVFGGKEGTKLQTAHRNFKNLVERVSHVQEGAIGRSIMDAFTSTVSKMQERDLTKTLVMTDMLSVYNYFSKDMGKLRNILSSDTARKDTVDSLRSSLEKRLGEYSNPVFAQVHGLAQQMVFSDSKEANQMLNMDNILSGAAYFDINPTYAKKLNKALSNDKNLVDMLNAYTSLVALNKTSMVSRKSLNTVLTENPDDVGIENLFQNMQTYQKRSKERLFENSERLMIKGHMGTSYAVKHDVMFAHASRHKELTQQGYEVVSETFYNNAGTNYNMYVRRAMAGSDMVSGPMNNLLMHSQGTTINDIVNVDPTKVYEDVAPVTQAMKKTEAQRAYNEQVLGHAPSTKSSNMVPITNAKGHVVNYRFMLPETKQDSLLKKEYRLGKVVGSSFGLVERKVNSRVASNETVDTLYADYKENYQDNPDDFIWVNGNETDLYGNVNEYVDEFRKISPDSINKINSLFGGKGIPVRKKHVRMMFGGRKMSITNSFAIDFLQSRFPEIPVTYYAGVIESFWKEVVNKTKLDIVIKTPQVLATNILSNTVLLVLRGVPIKKAFQDQFKAIKYLNAYEADETKMLQLTSLLESESNPSKKKQLSSEIGMLNSRLERNPVHSMMQQGLFQTIVEDVDLEAHGYFENMREWADNKMGNGKIAKYAGAAFDISYMNSNTKMFKVLAKATQYSDFSARFALINNEVELNKKRKPEDVLEMEAIVNDAVETFINYDKLDGELLEYLNEVGLLMFTKFFIGIQRVIIRLLKERAVTTGLATGAQLALGDIEDLLDSSLFIKDFGTLVYGPDEVTGTFINAEGLALIEDLLSIFRS